MKRIYCFCIYNEKSDKPRAVGFRLDGKDTFFNLFRPGEAKSVKQVLDRVDKIKSFLLRANHQGHQIFLSDFRLWIQSFNLPIDTREYNVYDQHLPKIESASSYDEDVDKIGRILDTFGCKEPSPWRKVSSNASIVYEDLERKGLLQNYTKQYPRWSQKTYSGRSKSSVFNVQGWHEDDHIRTPGSSDRDLLIHLDWICADIRVASLLSEDSLLQQTFKDSDPYDLMCNIINEGASKDAAVSRDNCKESLLRSINSMDFENPVFEIYEGLGSWIKDCNHKIFDKGYLKSLLGRKFHLKRAKNDLAVLNGAMQGSVAHAMQHTLKRIWDVFPNCIIADIHDSLVLNASSDRRILRSMLEIIVPIMVYPFEGLLPDNPAFPVRVSIGNKWKQWKHHKTYRE